MVLIVDSHFQELKEWKVTSMNKIYELLANINGGAVSLDVRFGLYYFWVY